MRKLLFWGVVLTPAYASVTLQNLNPYAEFTDSTRIESIAGVLMSTVAAGSEVFCEADYAQGTAAHFYQDFTQSGGVFEPPDVSGYAEGSILSYACGVRDATTLEDMNFREPPVLFDSSSSTGKILVTFTGTCSPDLPMFGNSSITNLGTYNGTRQYAANVSSTLSFQCLQPYATAITATAQLSLQPKEISDFISDAVFSLPLEFSETNDWKTFHTEKTLVFDLGTEKPHLSYYEALDTCQSQLCKGSLLLEYGFSKKALVTDLMNSTLMYRAVRDEFGVCNSAIVDEERIYTTQEACYGKYALLHDVVNETDGNFLHPLECPFHDDLVISSPANVQACFDTESEFDNTCEASLGRTSDASLLGGVFTKVLTNTQVNRSFSYTFVDTLTGSQRRFQTVPLLNISIEPIFLEPDQLYFFIKFNLTSFTEPDAVKLHDPVTGWSRSISLSAQLEVQDIPRQVQHIDLVGKVRTGCGYEDMSLLHSGAVPLPIFEAGVTSGKFVQVDPCQDLFLYYRDKYQQHALSISGAVGISRLETAQVRVCGVNTTGCELSNDVVIPQGSSSDIWAHINGACHFQQDIGVDSDGQQLQKTSYVAEGETIGYVLMDQASGTTAHAPVMCGGFCTDGVVRLPDLSLDWEIEFSVEKNVVVFTTDQDKAAYNDFKFNSNGERDYVLQKTAFLANPADSVCRADGSLAGSVPTSMEAPFGCLVYQDTSDELGHFNLSTASVFSGVNGAMDMIDYLSSCGHRPEDQSGGEAQLVQQFKIDYTDTNQTETFCHSSLVSVLLETKIVGLSSATLAVSEVVNQADGNQIGVSIGNVAFEQCVGGYKVVSTVDLEHDIVGETWTVDDTGSDFEASMVPGFEAVQWESECRDVCVSEPQYLTNWTNGTQTLLAGVQASGGAKAAVAFEVSIAGSPCAIVDNFDGSGEVIVDLYTAEGSVCSDSDTRANKQPFADQSLCSHLTFDHLGDFELTVTGTMMTRKHQGGLAHVLCEEIGDPGCIGDPRGTMFQAGKTLNATHNTATSSGIFQLEQSDSFSNITYIVFWEQNYMGNTRRLRSTHTFGESQMSSMSVLTILPSNAQMGGSPGEITYDVATGIPAFVTSPSASITPSTTDKSSTSWGLILAIAGGVVIGGAYMYYKRKPSYKKLINQGANNLRESQLKKAGYKRVKRYEHLKSEFTTDF